MSSKVAECEECGRLYDTLVNTTCPACSTGTVQIDEAQRAVEAESDDGRQSEQ